MNESITISEKDTLSSSKGLFQERWDIFKRNRIAYGSFWSLMSMFLLAFFGKVFTQYIVIFDPKIVRLSE